MAGSVSGFVDIHSHILWGLDDGAQDLKMSLEMLRIAAESGTSDIVATPHSNLQFDFQPDVIDARIRQLSLGPGPQPRIHWGCDFHLHFDNIADCLAHPTKYTINHLRYLMVEFSDLSIPPSTTQVFERMLQTGITPIITHPERNPLLMNKPGRLVEWIHAGCLLQVTAQSFLGRFGRQPQNAAGDLMSRGMVHFIASDAHDSVDRPPDLMPAFSLIVKRHGQETAQRLFITNPAATLTGEQIQVEMPAAPETRRRWFSFW
jgi:protein-tyrosine phosphatase